MPYFGVLSQNSLPPSTLEPSIMDVMWTKPNQVSWRFTWQVSNNDPITAEIFSEANDSTPDVSRGIIAQYASTATITFTSAFSSATLYAQAIATDGRPASTIVSEYVEGF